MAQITLNSSGITSSGALALQSNGTTTAVTVDTSQNVGIGTTSPTARLHVQSTGGTVFNLKDNTASGGGYANIFFSSDTVNANGYLGYNNSTNAMNFGTGNTERARIDSSGNLGIGTTSPTGRLHLVDSAASCNLIIDGQSAANKGSALVFRKGGTDVAYLGQASTILGGGSTSNDLIFYAEGAINQLFYTNAQERVRINSSGQFLVGATDTTYGSIGACKLTVKNATSDGAALFYTGFSGDVSTSAVNIGKFDNNNTSSQIFVKFAINSAGAGCGQINANGSGAATFASFSDSRLKENITDLPSQLSSICALRPVEFNYIEAEGGGHQIGFIAQEVQAVYPDTVGERSDGMLTLSGWSKTESRLVKAIQELNAKFEAYKASHP